MWVLSDGAQCLEGALVSDLNHLVADGALRRGTVLRVLDFVCNSQHHRQPQVKNHPREIPLSISCYVGWPLCVRAFASNIVP